MSCQSTGGHPSPTVKWFKDNTEITHGITSTTTSRTVTTTWTFIASLNVHLEAYECQAENGVLQNPLSSTVFIEVYCKKK